MIGSALRVKDYSYLNRRRKHKSETCFNFAMIGCEIHVEIGQNLPKSTAEPLEYFNSSRVRKLCIKCVCILQMSRL